MSKPTPNMSAAQCLELSAAQCEVLSPTANPTDYQIVTALIPVWGFGSFNDIISFAGGPQIVYNDDWPAVYNKQVEIWSDSRSACTRTTEFSQTDFQTTNSVFTLGPPPFQPDVSSIISKTVSPSSITVSYNDSLGGIGTYTATLSDDMLGNAGPFDASTHWTTLAAQASSLLAMVSIPSLTGTPGIIHVFPATGTPSYSIVGGSLILAAAYGAPIRSTNATNNPYNSDYTIGLSILDFPAFPAFTGVQQNIGFVFCTKSTWKLTGAAPATDPNKNNHLWVYAQQTTSVPSMVALVLTIGSPSLNGTIYSNPIFPKTITILDTDVAIVANGGYTYGVIGFRPTMQ